MRPFIKVEFETISNGGECYYTIVSRPEVPGIHGPFTKDTDAIINANGVRLVRTKFTRVQFWIEVK